MFKILYIDDNEAELELARDDFRGEVDCCLDTKVTKDIINNYDLIILDTFISNQDVKLMLEGIKVILCSSINYTGSRYVSAVQNPLGFPFISKPVSYKKIIEALCQI